MKKQNVREIEANFHMGQLSSSLMVKVKQISLKIFLTKEQDWSRTSATFISSWSIKLNPKEQINRKTDDQKTK